jgi:hypothetical protein
VYNILWDILLMNWEILIVNVKLVYPHANQLLLVALLIQTANCAPFHARRYSMPRDSQPELKLQSALALAATLSTAPRKSVLLTALF